MTILRCRWQKSMLVTFQSVTNDIEPENSVWSNVIFWFNFRNPFGQIHDHVTNVSFDSISNSSSLNFWSKKIRSTWFRSTFYPKMHRLTIHKWTKTVTRHIMINFGEKRLTKSTLSTGQSKSENCKISLRELAIFMLKNNHWSVTTKL